eukprot:TRINITY_DN1830_c0_g1_i5.p1 TRINITY_DN1830_c0_g1~~TRINITY_DN1830_c0_g1_i5.p1  ORF type:complete len:448 (-),score=94.48 TRINITY_DN1830_c0_g1_i5:40-1383(-)
MEIPLTDEGTAQHETPVDENLVEVGPHLPNEVLLLIFSYLRDAQTLMRVSGVCKQWREVAKDDTLWKQLFYMKHKKPSKKMLRFLDSADIFEVSWKYLYFAKSDIENVTWMHAREPVLTIDVSQATASPGFLYPNCFKVIESDPTNLRLVCGTSVSAADYVSSTVMQRVKPVQLWSLSNSNLITSFDRHTTSVSDIQVDETRILTAAGDGAILWDLYAGAGQQNILFRLTEHTKGVTGARFNDRVIVTASKDNTVKIWDMQGTCMQTIPHANGEPKHVRLDNTRCLTTTNKGRVNMFDLATGTCTSTLFAHNGSVQSFVYSPEDSILLTSTKKKIKHWDLNSGVCIREMKSKSYLTCMHYSKDRIVAGDAFGKIHLFDWNIGECFNVMRVSKSCVYGVEVCRKDTLVTSSAQGISLFDFSIDTYNNSQLLNSSPSLSGSGNNKCIIS